MRKMSIYSPPKMLIENYMMEIAKSFNVDFQPDPLALLVCIKQRMATAVCREVSPTGVYIVLLRIEATCNERFQ